MVKIVHQNTCANFVNSSLDNSNWDKIKFNKEFNKKLHISNRVRLFLRGKKIIINQLLSKVCYIIQIYTIPKYIKKGIEKRIYNFLQNNKKKSDFPDTQTLLGHFRHRHSIKFSKNKIDSKIIKSHQCSLERSHAVLIEY